MDGKGLGLAAREVTVMDELMGMDDRMDDGGRGFLVCCLDDAVTVVAGVRVASMEGC